VKRTAAALGGALLLLPLLLGLAVAGLTSANTAAACTPNASPTVDPSAVAAEVKAILAGGKTGSLTVAGLSNPASQIPNAATITATGIAMNVPVYGQVIALATALQESGLENLSSGDRDSLGLFQQRPSQGWGSPSQIMDPVYASTQFYDHLLKVSGWQQLTLTQAAQAVQDSGYPDAYAKWQALATALQQAIAQALPTSPTASTSPAPRTASPTALPVPGSTTSPAPTSTTGAADDGCSADGGGDGASFGPIPPGSVPAGYQIPATAPAAVQTAIRWAMGQLGTPYQWGGSCTDPHGSDPMGRCDCSSFVQQAYHAAGITLERTTYQQVFEGTASDLAHLQPGDLLFTEGSATAPGHVGMYMGDGLVINAPHTGAVVDIDTLAFWAPQVLAVRQIVG